MKIDVHAHHFPKEYLSEIEQLAEDTPQDQAWLKMIRDKVSVSSKMWSTA